MAQTNLAIRGIEPDLGSYAADTFLDDRHPTMRADYIMANPPFNLSDWGADKLKDDVRWQYGMPPAGNANFAWLQHMIHHLAPAGKIGMVLANGSLSSQSGGEGEIRKNIINADLVECIIAMPTQLFYTTQIPVSLWFLNTGNCCLCYGCRFANHSQEYVSFDYSRNGLLHDTDPYRLGSCVYNLLHKGWLKKVKFQFLGTFPRTGKCSRTPISERSKSWTSS